MQFQDGPPLALVEEAHCLLGVVPDPRHAHHPRGRAHDQTQHFSDDAAQLGRLAAVGLPASEVSQLVAVASQKLSASA